MGATSDQIQAEIARTRAEMTAKLDEVAPAQPGAGLLSRAATGIATQVRKQPLTLLGLSLVAGGLVRSATSGGGAGSQGSSSRSVTESAKGGAGAASNVLSQAGSNAADTVAGAARSAGGTVAGATGAVQHAAGSAVDSASSALSTVGGAASNAASQVAESASDAAGQVAQTAGDAASTVSQSVRNLGSAGAEQVRRRPLTAFAVAVGAGMLAQPVLAPQLSKVVQGAGDQVTMLGNSD